MDGTVLTFIDVGAAEQFQPRWLRAASHLNYIGFEPDSRSRQKLLQTSQGSASYRILETALSDRSDHLHLSLCRRPTVSSTLDPDVEWLQRFPDVDRFDILERVELLTSTLDLLQFEPADFIKIDVQGGRTGGSDRRP